MPIYEYKCDACGHRFEEFQLLGEGPLSDCPECDAAKLRKLISPVAFRLKGGGWYETDFKPDNKRNVVESGTDADKGKDSADGDQKKGSEVKTSEGASSESKSDAKASKNSSESSKSESTSAPSG